MQLTKYDKAQLTTPWAMEQPAPRQDRRNPGTPKLGLMANPEFVADLDSGMSQTAIAEKWQISRTSVGRYQRKMRGVQHG